MNRVLDLRRPRRARRSSAPQAPTVSVLRWPAGEAATGVFEMFSAHEAGRFGSREPESSPSTRENVLFVSASRRVAPETPAVLLSLVNTSPSQAVRLSMKLAGRTPTSVTGTVLTAPLMAPRQEVSREASHASNAVQPVAFHDAVLNGKVVQITVPARSVVVLTVHQPARRRSQNRPDRQEGSEWK